MHCFYIKSCRLNGTKSLNFYNLICNILIIGYLRLYTSAVYLFLYLYKTKSLDLQYQLTRESLTLYFKTMFYLVKSQIRFDLDLISQSCNNQTIIILNNKFPADKTSDFCMAPFFTTS